MFKRKKKSTPSEAVEQCLKAPPKSAAELEAERTIARGERVKSLSEEAQMWRRFATSCKPGRLVWEHVFASAFNYEHPTQLYATMDELSAELWREFALRMAADRESRLRDVLGIVAA
jgi:hypothetical protein